VTSSLSEAIGAVNSSLYLPLAALALLTWLVAGWSGLAIGFSEWTGHATEEFSLSEDFLGHDEERDDRDP